LPFTTDTGLNPTSLKSRMLTFMKRLPSICSKVLVALFIIASLTTAIPVGKLAAAVIWSELFVDSDGDYGVGYYADVDNLYIGSTDTDSDNLIALIETYNAPSLSFFVSGYGSLSFDTNGDNVDDFIAYAPNATMSAFSYQSRIVNTGQGGLTNCTSLWSMTSDYSSYAVIIPWRCLGAPAQTRIEVWLSNGAGFDFLDYGRTVYPILAPPPTTTVPPTTVPPTLPPTTVPAVVYVAPAPQTTLPLAATANTATPGLVDDWIEYLVVKQPVSLTAVINSTNCCYGVKTGTRVMKVLPKSKGSCVVRGKRLYAVKTGTCYVKVTVGSKNKKSETLKFKVRKN
jgi:hypothetical protein